MFTINQKKIRKCCVCDKQLYGRSDKVFCGITCKNTYHGALMRENKSASKIAVQNLHKNYTILLTMMARNCEKMSVKKLTLEKLGFNFSTVSGIEKTPYGIKMKVFEISWYYSSQDNIILLQDIEQSPISPFIVKRWEYHLESTQIVMPPNSPMPPN